MTDRSNAIAREITWALGRSVGVFRELMARPDVLEVMAEAHDAESSAQMGEPSAWRADLMEQYRDEQGEAAMEEWKSERRAAMLCAIKAVGLA